MMKVPLLTWGTDEKQSEETLPLVLLPDIEPRNGASMTVVTLWLIFLDTGWLMTRILNSETPTGRYLRVPLPWNSPS